MYLGIYNNYDNHIKILTVVYIDECLFISFDQLFLNMNHPIQVSSKVAFHVDDNSYQFLLAQFVVVIQSPHCKNEEIYYYMLKQLHEIK